MTRLALLLAAASLSAFGQYKMEPLSTGAPDLPQALAGAVAQQGYRVIGPDGPFCEIWFRTSLPTAPKASEDGVAFPTVPQGAFLGVIRFPNSGADRRGQTIKPGLYTMRYAWYPINGEHQGVAPQRDFAVLAPAAEDKDPNAMPTYDQLMNMSRKASGTPHPAVLSMETPRSSTLPALVQEGSEDWSLGVKVGNQPIGLIVVGKSEA
jgi:hypothetical protein